MNVMKIMKHKFETFKADFLRRSWARVAARACAIAFLAALALLMPRGKTDAAEDYVRALKRAQYLLNATVPTDSEFSQSASSREGYERAVRRFVSSDNFYDAVLRYHERVFGVGLPQEYLEDLQRSDIDGKSIKFARLQCARENNRNGRFTCTWNGGTTGRKLGQCPKSQEEPVTPFWRPGIVVWVCPSVAQACSSDLSKCFIEYENEDEARNTEIGTSEAFDSRFTIIKSLSRQAAGLATAVVSENFPYTKILEPGLSAVDGAIAHFYRQTHHFDTTKLHIPQDLLNQLQQFKITDTRFKLVYTGNAYESAGVLSTFGFLRRYEKNRTRANQLYERLMCRKFTAELPRVFPQDPGNLRTTPGCSGCHATLDPLADFFSMWGEGGDLYGGKAKAVQGSFIGQNGVGLSRLADIIRNDEAFATCTVQNVWKWLMGREFYKDEEELRTTLTQYFVTTKYSFRELVYALATHPAFVSGQRMDATVTDPLSQPPIGKVPEPVTRECKPNVDFSADIAPHLSQCTSCHRAGTTRQPLETESHWRALGSQAVGMMASGNMPPGQSGPPTQGAVYDLKESVRCWLEQNP